MFKSKKDNDLVTKIAKYKEVFSTVNGKWVLLDLMKTHGILMSSAENEPHMTYFREGARSVVVRILRTLQVDEGELLKHIEEMRLQND
jgi:hypothetical protein